MEDFVRDQENFKNQLSYSFFELKSIEEEIK